MQLFGNQCVLGTIIVLVLSLVTGCNSSGSEAVNEQIIVVTSESGSIIDGGIDDD